MDPATAKLIAQGLLTGIQLINHARRLADPTGGDLRIKQILDAGVAGHLAPEEVEIQLLQRSAESVDDAFDELGDALKERGVET